MTPEELEVKRVMQLKLHQITFTYCEISQVTLVIKKNFKFCFNLQRYERRIREAARKGFDKSQDGTAPDPRKNLQA